MFPVIVGPRALPWAKFVFRFQRAKMPEENWREILNAKLTLNKFRTEKSDSRRGVATKRL